MAEPAVDKLKVSRSAAERYRNPVRLHTLILRNVAGLHDQMLS